VFVETPGITGVSPAVQSRKNGLGTAALVLGVASLVAALSFVLLPLALIGGVLAVAIGVAALTRGRAGGTANPGQATAGLVCGLVALAAVFIISVRVGSFMAQNTGAFTSVNHCIAKAGDRNEVANCIARFARALR
jgi:hypothetical protein